MSLNFDCAHSIDLSLNENQLKEVRFSFDDQERYVWYYTPHPQNGLLIFDMKPYQRKLSYDLLELSYSSSGYKTAKSIINLNTLDHKNNLFNLKKYLPNLKIIH